MRGRRVRAGGLCVFPAANSLLQRADGTFYAAVELSLDENVKLPENATATVAQTSLLGSQHVELAEPADQKGVGRLKDGSQIPLDRTGRKQAPKK